MYVLIYMSFCFIFAFIDRSSKGKRSIFKYNINNSQSPKEINIMQINYELVNWIWRWRRRKYVYWIIIKFGCYYADINFSYFPFSVSLIVPSSGNNNNSRRKKNKKNINMELRLLGTKSAINLSWRYEAIYENKWMKLKFFNFLSAEKRSSRECWGESVKRNWCVEWSMAWNAIFAI